MVVFLITSFALAQANPQVFPFMPYVWPYIAGRSLTYTGTELESAPAPQFALQNQHGATVSLADQQGKVVLLTFLDPLCTDDCLLLTQEIAAAQQQLGADSDGLLVLAINVNPAEQTPEQCSRFSKARGLNRISRGII